MYKLFCSNEHVRLVSANELHDLISAVSYGCPKCNGDVAIEDGVGLTCPYCGESAGAETIKVAYEVMDKGCPVCRTPLYVSDSNQHVKEVWEHLTNEVCPHPLIRNQRIDYWEGLVHFCSSDEFSSIYYTGGILASETGYFGKPAVCLTEAPLGTWGEVKKAHGDFGFVFDKRTFMKHGGAPAFYMPESLIVVQKAKGFAEELKPFVNLVRRDNSKYYDFRHEREWRLPKNLFFNEIAPFAVVLGDLTDEMDWHAIAGAVVNFGTIDNTK